MASQEVFRQTYILQTSLGNISIETHNRFNKESVLYFPFIVLKYSNNKIKQFDFNAGTLNDDPSLNYSVIKIPELYDSVIVVSSASCGGSDCSYESTFIGIVDGEIKELFQERLQSQVQGALCIEQIKKSNSTQIILWNELWEDGWHYAPHRYKASIFQWDGHNFTKTKILKTRKKYSNWEKAANSYGIRSGYDYVAHLLPDYR